MAGRVWRKEQKKRISGKNGSNLTAEEIKRSKTQLLQMEAMPKRLMPNGQTKKTNFVIYCKIIMRRKSRRKGDNEAKDI